MNLNQSSEKKKKWGKGQNCYYHPHWRWMIWNPPIWSWWMVTPPYSGKWVTSPTKHLPPASLRRRRARSCPNLTTRFNGVWKEGAPGVQHHVDSEAVSEFSLVPGLPVKTTKIYIYIHFFFSFSIFLWLYFQSRSAWKITISFFWDLSFFCPGGSQNQYR